VEAESAVLRGCGRRGTEESLRGTNQVFRSGREGAKCRSKAMMTLLGNPLVLPSAPQFPRLVAIWHREYRFGIMAV
jgi:hypothetical protein